MDWHDEPASDLFWMIIPQDHDFRESFTPYTRAMARSDTMYMMEPATIDRWLEAYDAQVPIFDGKDDGDLPFDFSSVEAPPIIVVGPSNPGDGGGGGGGSPGDRGYDTSPPPPHGGDPTPPETHYPADFDQKLDCAVDGQATSLARQIAAKGDTDKVEYVAAIWRDAQGNTHSTTVERGTGITAPSSLVWGQIDFAGGGQVVAIIHSHPNLQNTGSVENPQWTHRPDWDTLSSVDFDQLIHRGTGKAAGFDAANYRSYLVAGTNVSEYYAFEQDHSRLQQGVQATWAVKSKDYSIPRCG